MSKYWHNYAPKAIGKFLTYSEQQDVERVLKDFGVTDLTVNALGIGFIAPSRMCVCLASVVSRVSQGRVDISLDEVIVDLLDEPEPKPPTDKLPSVLDKYLQ